jgi:regulatory protein
MIVTQIEQLSRNRYKIFIDQEFAFVLYKGELCQYGIAIEKAILQEEYIAAPEVCEVI